MILPRHSTTTELLPPYQADIEMVVDSCERHKEGLKDLERLNPGAARGPWG
jgi:hypothetical protein